MATTTGQGLWTSTQIDDIADKLTIDMEAGKHVLEYPLENDMPSGDEACDELNWALGDLFTVTIDPIEATMTLIPQVNGRKMGKVRRPKNCFVIYRLDEHPKIKALNPGMSNNDYSKIIGVKWRHEPQEVKDEYKRRAEVERLQHAIDHPGYQYQPRKPSEKKKRMTKNKLAKLTTSSRTLPQNTQAAQQQLQLPLFTLPTLAGPQLDVNAVLHSTGGDLSDLPHFRMPGPFKHTGPRSVAPVSPVTTEQKRQDVLDVENDMNQFFDFNKAIDDITSTVAANSVWEVDWT